MEERDGWRKGEREGWREREREQEIERKKISQVQLNSCNFSQPLYEVKCLCVCVCVWGVCVCVFVWGGVTVRSWPSERLRLQESNEAQRDSGAEQQSLSFPLSFFL